MSAGAELSLLHLLGGISWRGPFFGVAALMLVALVARAVLLPRSPRPDHHTSLLVPLRHCATVVC